MGLKEIIACADRLYEDSSMPVAVTDEKFEVQWANREALKRFPALAFKNGMQDIISQYDHQKLLEHLSSGKAFTSNPNLPLNVSRMMVKPIIDKSLEGCIFILAGKEDIFPEQNNMGKQEGVIASFANAYKMPLTIIFSTLGLMAREIHPEDREMASYLKMVSQNCYRLYRLSNNISEIVRFNAGLKELNLQNGDLTFFINNLCEAAGVLTSAIAIPLEKDTPDQPVITAFDPALLSIAFLNLISNSCKFTREGNLIRVKMEKFNDHVAVTVSDRGIGIRKDVLGHIFDPYFSFEPNGRPAGGGIGLAIVKNIIMMHGGTIAVESRENEGTKVAFTLPIRRDDKAPDYTAETSIDYLADRFSSIYIELSDVCGSPMP